MIGVLGVVCMACAIVLMIAFLHEDEERHGFMAACLSLIAAICFLIHVERTELDECERKFNVYECRLIAVPLKGEEDAAN